jgi:hypothetical protein
VEYGDSFGVWTEGLVLGGCGGGGGLGGLGGLVLMERGGFRVVVDCAG